ncbi:MAG: elongation factor Ts [Betaproteobacteria bacterium]|nr:elongation factor Ts [Betaproteobacteria bacterium]
MAEITASQVKELREMTGLGMMECKKALAESGGSLTKAEELLRIRSGAKASKAAGRIAAEGVIGVWIAPDERAAAMVELNCETDFVAKNEDFLAFASSLAEMVAREDPADVAALARLSLNGIAVEAKRQALVQKIGENLSIRRFRRMRSDARLARYLHGTRIGVLVDFDGPDEVGKDLAMHIAFAKPRYLGKADVAPELVSREREILVARAKDSGKPADIAAKMVDGGINKFLGEITLLGQPFVKDDKQTVEKMLAARKARIFGYAFLVVGEGIEKKISDFAAEVMAQAGAADRHG